MSGSFLLLGAAMALGADAPATPPAPPAAAPITVSGTGCGGCGAPAVWSGGWGACDPCASPRIGLLDRLRARFARNTCAPACAPAPVCAPACAPAPAPVCAPACGRPLFTGFTTSCADPCQRQGLLSWLRGKFRNGRSCDACASPCPCGSWGSGAVGGCATSNGTVLTPAPGTPGAPPQNMPAPGGGTGPKKDEPKKEEPKKELSSALPTVDAPRVPTLGGVGGKY